MKAEKDIILIDNRENRPNYTGNFDGTSDGLMPKPMVDKTSDQSGSVSMYRHAASPL